MNPCVVVAARAMLKAITKPESPKNVVVSPMSISGALSVLAFGSDGETLKQFTRFLSARDTGELLSKSRAVFALLSSSGGGAETSRSQNDNCEDKTTEKRQRRSRSSGTLAMDTFNRRRDGRKPYFSTANAIWVDHRCHLKPSFVEITQSEFRASVKHVDIVNESEQVRKDVNVWAEKETKGLIKNLLPESTKLLPPFWLANALYFKGAWKIPFEASNTSDEDFHLLNAQTTKVPFMIMEDERLSYGSFPDFKLLKLPYQQGKATNKQFSMYIFLPHQRDGLRCLLEKFSSGCTSLRLENIHLQREELSRVWIPKMKFSYSFDDVKDHIEAEGLTLPFSEYGADFSKMASSSAGMFVNSICQKCVIEVNEEGTEAAAVTCMGFGCAMSSTPPPPKPSFVADHPFIFMIVEDFTKNIAFTGAVLNPLLTE